MSVSASYLEATVNAAVVAKHHRISAFVNISQMTVSEMSINSTTDSPQQKMHWLAEQVLNWSGLPFVHIRPTSFMETFFSDWQHMRSESITNPLPFGMGKTSPIASGDVARVIAAIIADPAQHIGKVYNLTGPLSQDMNGVAAEFSRALGRPITYVDVPLEPWRRQLEQMGMLSPHTVAHLTTMALLKQQNRYDRLTTDVEQITGMPAQSVFDFVLHHAGIYGGSS